MPKKAGIVLSMMGAVLMISALLLFLYNDREGKEAGRQADAALNQLQAMMESMQQAMEESKQPGEDPEHVDPEAGDGQDGPHGFGERDPNGFGEKDPDSTADPQKSTTEDNYLLLDPEDLPVVMPILWVDGYDYIGYLEIPALKLQLPVMGDWDYDRLKIAPCRHFGATGTSDLVIAGHNYDQFFARLGSLKEEDLVRFTDVEGRRLTYQVHQVVSLAPESVEAVQYSGYDLVLYTCNESATTRIAAFCDLVEVEIRQTATSHR